MMHTKTFKAILRNGLLACLFGTLTACVDFDMTSSQNENTALTVEVSPSVTNTPTSDTPVIGSTSDVPSSSDTRVTSIGIPDVTLTLSWQPNPGNDIMDGYIVYYGTDANTVNTEVSTITVSAAGFDPSAPSIQFSSWSDLGVQPGDYVCFKVRAYNSIGTSDPSPAICETVPATV